MTLETVETDIPASFATSNIVAKFLQNQAPGCSAYVIGDHGLYNALYDAGITINDVDPAHVCPSSIYISTNISKTAYP